MRRFSRFACFDWSGQAVARPKGIALAAADADSPPRLIAPDGGWSRQAALDWFMKAAQRKDDMLIGMDLSPAFPFLDEQSYFPGWPDSPADAPALWDLVERLSADDPHLSATSFLQHPEIRRHFRFQGDCGDLFPPGRGRLRICEHGQADMKLSPYSCFNLVGAAQVGKSSLTGMRLFHRLRGIIPFWPFDPLPETGPVIVEIYTALAARTAGLRKGVSKMRDATALDAALAELGSPPHDALEQYHDHATDALLTAAWLRTVAADPRRWFPERSEEHTSELQSH